MDISSVINFLKLPKKVILLIAIISATMLFSTQNFMEQLSLFKFKEEYNTWIGISFLFSVGISFLNLGEYIINLLKVNKNKKLEVVRKKQREKEYLLMLHRLDNDELLSIREFYLCQKNTIEMISNDSGVKGLISKGIILVIGTGWSSKFITNVYSFELSVPARQYFDKFEFQKLKNQDRPLWVEELTNHYEQKSMALDRINDIFKY